MKYFKLLVVVLLILSACKNEIKPEKQGLVKLKADKVLIQKQVDSLNKKLKKIEKAIKKMDTLKKLQKVTTLKVQDSVFRHYIELQGIVSSDKNVNIRPEIGGIVKRIFVKKGQSVYKGQSILQLDTQALLDKVNELKTQLALATTTYERQERLWKKKIGSEMQYLGAKTRKEAIENSLQSLYTQINKMKVKAAFSGIIDDVFAKEGELVGPQMPVARLINLNKMYIEADIPETYLNSVKKGTPVLLNFTAIGKQIPAKITEVGNFINPNNRSFKIRIEVRNPKHSLKPNMLADIHINDFQEKGVVLPMSIIQMNQQGEEFVYKIERDSTKTLVRKTRVVPGISYNDQVLINEGLKPGDIIVKEGGKFVKDGAEVSIKNE